MKLLQIATCGMKNLSNEIKISFANSTIENGVKKINNVKGIFGFNGAGKTAFIQSVELYRNIVLNPTYLLQNDTTKRLDKLLNFSLKSFDFSIIFSLDDNIIVKHSLRIARKKSINFYYIEYEDVSLLTGRTLDEKYNPLITKENKELYLSSNLETYLKNNAELDYSSFITKFVTNLLEIKKDNKSTLLKNEEVVVKLYTAINNIDTFLLNDDAHNNYVIDINALDKIINHTEKLKEKRETWVDIYLDDVSIPINLFSIFEKENKKLEKFIQTFKPEVKEIKLDKSIDGDIYHVRRVFQYENYEIELEFESSGIKQLVKLFSYLSKCSKGGFVFVDEIDININTIYFTKLISFFKNYGKGQLIFTTHNIEVMNALKDQSKSICALGENNKIDTWVPKGNKSPINDYKEGYFPNSPMNIEDFDFINIFFGE